MFLSCGVNLATKVGFKRDKVFAVSFSKDTSHLSQCVVCVGAGNNFLRESLQSAFYITLCWLPVDLRTTLTTRNRPPPPQTSHFAARGRGSAVSTQTEGVGR